MPQLFSYTTLKNAYNRKLSMVKHARNSQLCVYNRLPLISLGLIHLPLMINKGAYNRQEL